MSRGLGAMQRKIIGTLDIAKRVVPHYRGGHRETWRDGEWFVTASGKKFYLPDDVYDLRASMRYIGPDRQWNDYLVRISFSRAVRCLIRDGYLKRARYFQVEQELPAKLTREYLQPMGDPELCWGPGLFHCSDGSYFFTGGRERRFVVKGDQFESAIGLIDTDELEAEAEVHLRIQQDRDRRLMAVLGVKC